MSLHYKLIDPAVLMNAAGDDAEGFRELLAMFVRIVPEGSRRLQLAIETLDQGAIAQEAHSLKSCLSLVGANGCAARLEQLERAARTRQLEPAAQFDNLYEELTAVIAEALDCHVQGALQARPAKP
jgi:HPt (histidine-containing phosphotransfer) domain-containing protein